MWTWELESEVDLEVEKQYYLDPFHPDGSRVWIQSKDLTTKGWSFGGLGSSPTPLSNLPLDRPYLDFIDGCFWKNGPSFVRDTVTGKEVFRLFGKYKSPHTTQWNGQHLIAGYNDGEVLLLDFKHLCSQ